MRARFFAILAVLFVILFYPFLAVRAGELSGDTVLTLDQLLDQMRAHNPQLTQAQANYQAAKAAIPQALAFEGPTVNLAEGQMPRHPLNVNKSQSFNYGLTQSFLFPGKRELAGEIAKADAEVAKTGIDKHTARSRLASQNQFLFAPGPAKATEDQRGQYLAARRHQKNRQSALCQ